MIDEGMPQTRSLMLGSTTTCLERSARARTTRLDRRRTRSSSPGLACTTTRLDGPCCRVTSTRSLLEATTSFARFPRNTDRSRFGSRCSPVRTGVLKFETTWQVTSDGLRLTTVIPFGGG